MAKGVVGKVIGFALDIAQFAIAIVLLVLAFRITFPEPIDLRNLNTHCLLDGSGGAGTLTGIQFCAYILAVGFVSIIASAILGCLTRCVGCFTANICGVKGFLSIVADAVLVVWWAVAFVLVLKRGTAANERGWPHAPLRNGIIATTFGGALLFFLDIIVTIVELCMS